jgi:hypothetical protein
MRTLLDLAAIGELDARGAQPATDHHFVAAAGGVGRDRPIAGSCAASSNESGEGCRF